MFPTVLPLRTIAYQTLFLIIAIAIESWVLHRFLRDEKQLPITPEQSVHFAATINLLCTVVGWLAFFLFFALSRALPSIWASRLEGNLVNFIFFDQWSNETATSLFLTCFVMFFASFGVKQVGLTGLRSLIQAQPEATDGTLGTDETSEGVIQEVIPVRRPSRSAIRILRDEANAPRAMTPQSRAIFYGNAWSFTAILAILLLRLVF
jgi:hypothetical protein